jgi:curved DNA-binding protein CbpA
MLAVGDPYKVLQVDPEADPEVIRAAYRRLAQKHHPDYGGNDRRMAELNAAYFVLRDPQRRAGYDAGRRRTARGGRAVSPMEPIGRPERSAPDVTDALRAAGPLARARAAQAVHRPSASGSGGSPGERVLDFGRYAGWSIAQIAGHDPDFLEWLERMPIGRQYRADIEAALAIVGRSPSRRGTSAAANPDVRMPAFQRASQARARTGFGGGRLAFLRR